MRRNRGSHQQQHAEWSCDDEDGTVLVGNDVQVRTHNRNDQPSSSSPTSEPSLSQLFDKIKVLKRGSQGVVYLARPRTQNHRHSGNSGADGELSIAGSDVGINKKGEAEDNSSSSSNSHVAIKRMFCDAREEKMRGLPEGILREIGIMSHLTRIHRSSNSNKLAPSSSLVQFQGVCATKSGEICLVMEACAGDVMSFVQAIGQPPLPFVSHVVRGMLLAVKELHANSVTHRDLKPSQVLLRDDGSVALADLGSARFIFSDDDDHGSGRKRTDASSDSAAATSAAPLTPGARRTTLPYRPPEILLGDRKYCGRAIDIWGVGVSMAELLRGSHLFTANTELQTLTRILGFIGTPTQQSWPEFDEFPLLQAFNFTPQAASLRKEVLSWRAATDFSRCVSGSRSCNNVAAAAASLDSSGIAEAVLDLLEAMMNANPRARPTVEQCLAHRFFELVPGSVDVWRRWKDDGDMPSKRPAVGMMLSLGGGPGDDDDDDEDVMCL